MAKPVQLANGRSWPTQKDALDHFREILARYASNQRIDTPEDHDDLCALLIRYDMTATSGQGTKRGSGIAYFSRERNVGEKWSTDGFHVHRTDGSAIDFSYIRAIKG